MCGIAGWIDFNNKINHEEKIIKAMGDTLVRRGPDEGGVFKSQKAVLVHRRLIVIDPENGKQPMNYQGNGRNYTLVYNGELYNTNELRKEIEAFGYEFKGHSDTEVLLASYVCFGESCVDKLNGIYAFAIWDSVKEELFVVRDRMGVKPLFYYDYNGGVIFGSQISTILSHPRVKHVIDENGLSELFMLGPGRTPGCGVIKGVKELKPGEYLKLSKGNMKLKYYWTLKAKEHLDDIETTKERTRELIIDAIERQLISDVPLCCFLSGGLDSSIISAIASKHYEKEGKGRLTTYSVNYTDNDKYFTKSMFQPNSDEVFIDIMSKFINSEHRNIELSNVDLGIALEGAMEARDLPGMADIDSSLLLFCREIKKDFTVGVSGECADELFGGYPWYHNEKILFEENFPWSRTLELRHNVLKSGIIKNGDDYVLERYLGTVKSTDKLSTDSALDSRMREMFMLNLYWFMQTLLDRKDRMSMYNGLEVRVPFCDHNIVEYAYNMPWNIKSREGREKGIVREAMEGILPEEILWRKKSPYPKTHNPIYMNLVSEGARKILNDKSSLAATLINHDTINGIIENPNALDQPWYGQLMRAPQVLAYIIQLDLWFKKFNIDIE